MILVDTSGVLAAIDPRQAFHSDVAPELRKPDRRILSPFVLAELDYLTTRHAGQVAALQILHDVAAGVYELQSFGSDDVSAAIQIMERYAALNLGLADASIMVLAERYDCFDILTLDERPFRAVVGRYGRPFRLLPHDG